jgi:hypothetical protein
MRVVVASKSKKKSETASHGTVDISTKEEAIWRKNVQPAGLPVKRGRDPELMCSRMHAVITVNLFCLPTAYIAVKRRLEWPAAYRFFSLAFADGHIFLINGLAAAFIGGWCGAPARLRLTQMSFATRPVRTD